MKLIFALNATTYAFRFAESAAEHFATDVDELESGSEIAASVAFIENCLSDAQKFLAEAEGEIGRLLLPNG